MGRRLYSYICYGVDLTDFSWDDMDQLCEEHGVRWHDDLFEKLGYEDVGLEVYAQDGDDCALLYARKLEYSEFEPKAVSFAPEDLVPTEEETQALHAVCEVLGIEDPKPRWYLLGSYI